MVAELGSELNGSLAELNLAFVMVLGSRATKRVPGQDTRVYQLRGCKHSRCRLIFYCCPAYSPFSRLSNKQPYVHET